MCCVIYSRPAHLTLHREFLIVPILPLHLHGHTQTHTPTEHETPVPFLNTLSMSRMPQNAGVGVPIHYSKVTCTGEQESLLHCPHSEVTIECGHTQDAGIVCRLNERGC